MRGKEGFVSDEASGEWRVTSGEKKAQDTPTPGVFAKEAVSC